MNLFMQNSMWGGRGFLVILPIILWTIFWKIAALWISSKNNQKRWFFALAILNTAGILEIIYIFYVAKKSWTDVKAVFSRTNPVQ